MIEFIAALIILGVGLSVRKWYFGEDKYYIEKVTYASGNEYYWVKKGNLVLDYCLSYERAKVVLQDAIDSDKSCKVVKREKIK